MTKRILSITAEGISFIDEHGTEGFVDFAACYRHYLAHRQRSVWERIGQFLRRYVQGVKPWREVGQRDNGAMQGGAPYISFYTTPPTRFTFASIEDYEAARNAIWRADWQTFDMS
jgi:hypothetical protein